MFSPLLEWGIIKTDLYDPKYDLTCGYKWECVYCGTTENDMSVRFSYYKLTLTRT